MKTYMNWKVRQKDLDWFDCALDRRLATKHARRAFKVDLIGRRVSQKIASGVLWDNNGQLVLPSR